MPNIISVAWVKNNHSKIQQNLQWPKISKQTVEWAMPFKPATPIESTNTDPYLSLGQLKVLMK